MLTGGAKVSMVETVLLEPSRSSAVKWQGECVTATVDGRRSLAAEVFVDSPGVTVDRAGGVRRFQRVQPGQDAAGESADAIHAPLTGRVIQVSVGQNSAVTKGETPCGHRSHEDGAPPDSPP